MNPSCAVTLYYSKSKTRANSPKKKDNVSKPGEAFREKYQEELNRNRNIRSDEAWNTAREKHPDLYRAMMAGGRTIQQVEMANEAEGNTPNARRDILANAIALKASSGCSHKAAIRTTCSVNPALAKAAGLTSDADQVQFANDTIGGGYAPNPATAAGQRDGSYKPAPGAVGTSSAIAPPGQAARAALEAQRGPEKLALFLNPDSSDDELDCAKGVGSKDPQKIFDALARLYAKKTGQDLDAAKLICVGFYPKLMAAGAKTPQIKYSPFEPRTITPPKA